MSNFDNEKGHYLPDQPDEPESFESMSHHILHNPTQIELNWPDRAQKGAAQEMSGFPTSKIIADILTPDRNIAIIYLETDDGKRALVVAGSTQNDRLLVEAGTEVDLSDVWGEGKCLVNFSDDGNHASIRAEHPDAAYQLYARVTSIDATPEFKDYSDDPDYPLDDYES